ncbi:unnamed protein product [Adineta steineri]|uniref:Hint domain-containing protein n=1 Tax=Adineta steineri TaxID=433720 RepID=A0A815M9I0_9BILA|nr:unnamed protein product [Adineta steineri]CAF1418545.1 unnamed protein product [Adineta steineri]
MSTFDLTISSAANCPVEADPVSILSCVAVDAVGLVQATKGNIKVFCTMAERFMECVKTKTRGCIGEEFVRGSLTELIELSQKCCVNKGEKMNEECPFVARPQCFSLNDTAQKPDGKQISIGNLQIGEKVLAIDKNDHIISTEIIAILHYENNSQALFYTFTTETGHQVSLTPEHLIYIGNRTYIQARHIDSKKHQLFIRGENNQIEASNIRSIDVELKHGYATPITQHGTLLVNSVSSSCYASIYYHSIGHMAMAPLRWIHQLKQIFGLINKNETNDNGIHWYPRALNNIVHMFIPFPDLFTTTAGKI